VNQTEQTLAIAELSRICAGRHDVLVCEVGLRWLLSHEPALVEFLTPCRPWVATPTEEGRRVFSELICIFENQT
jgi:hypothetical protein